MRRLLLLAAAVALALGTIAPAAAGQATASPGRLSACFGAHGVQFGSKDAYLCEVKLGDDPSGALYFMVTLGDTTTGENVVWYKLHPASGNFWVYETLTPRHTPGALRSDGRIVQIDVPGGGQCIVTFPSWTVTPHDCTDMTQGGQPAETHQMTPTEQRSLDEFMVNMRAAIPLEYR